MGLRIGIDLGGSSIKIGLVNGSYDILRKASFPLGADRGFDAVMDLVKAGVRELADGEIIDGGGIGVPSTVLDNRYAVPTPNLDWGNSDVGTALERRLPFPCTVSNDADCAAMAEHLAGAGRGIDSMAMITLGSGVGSSVIIDGRILRGARQCSVEFGHMKIVANGALCGCGSRGCAEAYCSATALIREIHKAAADKPYTILKKWLLEDGRKPSARMIFDGAAAGDPVSCAILDDYIHFLAILVSNVALCYRPQIIVIGGGISAAGDRLFDPLNAQLEGLIYGAKTMGYPRAIPAVLGNDAGILGAAIMPPD